MMPPRRSRDACSSLRTAMLTAFVILAWTVQGDPIGTTFTYQGVLKDGGAPADGTFDFVFRLYSDEDLMLGDQVGPDVVLNMVTVTDGLFTVELDFGAVFDGNERWLETEVDLTVLGPRQNLTPAPYALYAATAGEATIADDSLDFTELADALTADATTTIDLDTHSADLAVDGDTLVVDSSANRVGIGTSIPAVDLDVDGDLQASGTTTTGGLTITGLNCSGNTNGGALTADASGVVSCSDDDVGAGGDDLGSHTATQNLDLDTFKLVGNGSTDGLSIAADGTVRFDVPFTSVDVDAGSLTQTPGDPVEVGSLGFVSFPFAVSVSGRYAYLVDLGNSLRVVDVSDPSAPSEVGSLNMSFLTGSIFLSGRYAYLTRFGSNHFRVVDISDPSNPTPLGNLDLGGPGSVFVSGRYAYSANSTSNDLKVIDISDPSAPSVAGSLVLGDAPGAVFVSGRYAYAVGRDSGALKVIDVSDPGAPSLVGSEAIGDRPVFLYVSGRYAYVVDVDSNELKVIDVSDPSAPNLTGSLALGGDALSVFVSGRYAYVLVDSDLKVIDVLDPNAPSLVGSLELSEPRSVFVSGRYGDVADPRAGPGGELKVIDVSGAELGSAIVHSLEAGSLQVRQSLTTQGHLTVAGGVNIGPSGMSSDGGVGISGNLAIANDTAPTSSPANLVQLYAEDNAGSSELKVRDEAGNVTTLSPHNFSLIGAPSEPLAWSYYSENAHGKVNVDMMRAMRVLERVSGEKLVSVQTHAAADVAAGSVPQASLEARIEVLTRENRELRSKLARIEELLGIE